MICVFFCVFIGSTSIGSNVQIKLEGLSDELEQNVRMRVSSIIPEEIDNEHFFQGYVNEEARKALRALGYYQPTIEFILDEKPGILHHVLHAKVNPGEPVRIAGVNIVLKGDAITDKDFLTLLKKSRPAIGEILNHCKYDGVKDSLTSLAYRKGYFDIDMLKSHLDVAEDLHKAFWNIYIQSGSRYRFGKVIFEGSQIREDYLQNLVPFHQGNYFSAKELAELNRRLSATNWFDLIVVSPDFKSAKKNKVLSLYAIVTPRTSNTIEAGIGYSIDSGSRIQCFWKKPWLNAHAHSLGTSTSISVLEQQIDVTYKIPLLHNPTEQYYLLHGGVKNVDINDANSITSKLEVSRHWDLSNGWQRAVNLTWRIDHFTRGASTSTTMLLYPAVKVNRTRSRGGLMPSWGDNQRYSIDISNSALRSSVSFGLMQAHNVWIRTLIDKHRLVLRGQAGWIKTKNLEKVPSDLRFFAGGDRSIRGYKYKGIAPSDKEGNLLGASKIFTGSLEYQYNVTGKWWGSVFVDSGTAVDDIKQSNIKTGAGIGVRWQSPIGLLKLDIAAPVRDKESSGVQFYIGLGAEL